MVSCAFNYFGCAAIPSCGLSGDLRLPNMVQCTPPAGHLITLSRVTCVDRQAIVDWVFRGPIFATFEIYWSRRQRPPPIQRNRPFPQIIWKGERRQLNAVNAGLNGTYITRDFNHSKVEERKDENENIFCASPHERLSFLYEGIGILR